MPSERAVLMSNRLFQGIIHQMHDSIGRTVGIVDDSSVVIACSDLARVGERNDFLVSEMDNYQEMVDELDKHQDNLNKANEKSIKLDNNSVEVKDIVENLKNSFGSKDKYVLTKDDKDKLLNYIDNVNDTNNDYKNMKRLSNTLNNVDKELKENREIINTLTENNEALNLRVNTLTNKITEKEEEFDNLTSDNNNLKAELNKWKKRFLNIINFIKNRLLRPKDKDK